MKALVTTLYLMTMTYMIYGQSMIAKTYVEQTFYTPKVGTAIGYKFAGDYEIGGFVQKSTVDLQAEDGRPLHYEKEFIGAFFSYPMLTAYKTEVQMKVRTGITNMQNFTITPSVHANYKPAQVITIGAGVGVRAFKPTFMASLQINLYGKKNRMLLSSVE